MLCFLFEKFDSSYFEKALSVIKKKFKYRIHPPIKNVEFPCFFIRRCSRVIERVYSKLKPRLVNNDGVNGDHTYTTTY